MPGYRLNPYEEGVLGLIQSSANDPGAGDYGSMLLGLVQSTVGGAQDRRQQNIATREAGISALQAQAMQLAAQGGTSDAVTSAVLGQASDLPGMRGARGVGELAQLGGYVGSLYDPSSPVSGLAPPDFRAQFESGLPEAIRGAIGEAVQQGMDSSATMDQILASVREDAIKLGMPVEEEAAATEYAREVYYRMAGLSPTEIGQTTSQLGDVAASGDLDWLTNTLQGAGSPELSQRVDLLGDVSAEERPKAVEDLVRWAAGDATRLGNLYEILQQGAPPDTSNPWAAPLNLDNWFFQG